MTAAAAAAAAAVVAAAIPAFSAILCTRGDLAAPTIVRRVFWAKLFLAIEVLRFEACHVRVVTVRLSIFVSVLRRAAVLEDNAYKSPLFQSRNSVKPVLYRPHVVSRARRSTRLPLSFILAVLRS